MMRLSDSSEECPLPTLYFQSTVFIRNFVQGLVPKFLNLWPHFSSKRFLKVYSINKKMYSPYDD